MKRILWVVLLLPAVVLLGLAFMFQDLLFVSNSWFLVASVIGMVWLGFVLLFVNINKQVDDNPYYTEMVIKKRDEVRMRQKMYASAHQRP